MAAHPIHLAATEEREQGPVPVPSQKEPDPETISDFGKREGDSDMLKLPEEQMAAHQIHLAATEEREQGPVPVPSQKDPDPETISDFGKREGDPDMVMASTVPPPNRVKLLYKGHQMLNIIFGILIGSIAVLRWYTGRAEFDRNAILICLVDSSMLVLVCVLPQSMISIYCFFQKGSYVGLEAYIWTGAMVLDDYVALLMINIGYLGIVLIPGMILVFIITLGWKLRKSGTVQVGRSEKHHDGVNTMRTEKHKINEEIPYVERTNSSDKLELFDFVSYLLLLSLVTWTRYKGQQGCTPVLSDFLLFLGSALGALGTMLASPLAGVNSRAVSTEVLPVLHKTCIVVLFIAVHTLAAEWLGDDMIYVCLPELITVLVWFTVCFGESMSDSSFTSVRSELIICSSVVAILACLIPWNANVRNMLVSWIIWLFWISISSAAFSQFHVWLLHGWPVSSSESKKLIRLLKVVSTVGFITAILLLCAYMMVVTDPRILSEAIYSLEYKAIVVVVGVPIIFLLTLLVWSVCSQIRRILLTLILWYECSRKIPVTLKLSDMLENKLHPKLDKLLQDTLPSGVREIADCLQSKLKDMHPIIIYFESSSNVQGKTWISLVHELARDIDDWAESKMWEFQKRIIGAMEQGILLYFEENCKRNNVDRSPGNPVGLDGPRDNLVNMVRSESEEPGLKVVSIVGMPGSGKTALASLVYDSDRISRKFWCRCWAQLGRVDMVMAVNIIMLQLCGETSLFDVIYDSLDVKIKRISRFLQRTRYFVILDGLEDTETWSNIKACFPENNRGSWIIITTQIQDVAIASATAPDYVYKTSLLNRVQAETLFYQKAFRRDPGVCPDDDMKVISAQILEKCHGLPLAIVSMGHVLASKSSRADEFNRPGLPWQELQDMKMVIKHCYDKLHPELRMCLLYLSIFPVEKPIDVDRLVRLWIAEEFIKGRHPRTYEEKVVIANDYICELVRRNLIVCHDGINRTISIHPVIHDFIICVSLEENFVTLVHSQQEDVSPSNGTAPRLSLLNNGTQDRAATLSYGKKLLSVTVFGNTSGMPLLAETSRLHVLDLEGCNGPVFLDGLQKLLLLRYLGLKGTVVSELPAQIGQLTCLETLDVRSTKVKEIPPSILRLKKLMHLLAGNAKLPCGIRKMKMLFALSCPDVMTNSTSIMQELSQIDNLSELELFCDSTQVSQDKKLVAFPSDGFHRLHKLCVHCGHSPLIFETGALRHVQVLGLILEKGLPKEPTHVSGMEHLLSLQHVHFEYSGDDAKAKAMVAAMKKAVNTEVTVTGKVGTPSTPKHEELYRNLESDKILEEEEPYRNLELESDDILEEEELYTNLELESDEILEKEEPHSNPEQESEEIMDEEEPYRNPKQESEDILVEEEPYRNPKQESEEILEEEELCRNPKQESENILVEEEPHRNPEQESEEVPEEEEPYRNPEQEPEEILEEEKPEGYYDRLGGPPDDKRIPTSLEPSSPLHVFTVEELKSATSEFSDESLMDFFMPNYAVYNGLLEGNLRPRLARQQVAVMRIEETDHQLRMFCSVIEQADAAYRQMRIHPHLLKLLGFCNSGQQRLLVYEYMPKGSLKDHFTKDLTASLTWLTRLSIIIGVAKGLAFLHELDIPMTFGHFDASNILLDSDYTAKLWGFRLEKENQGTPAAIKSEKADLYNFGVVLLQLLAGPRRNAHEVLAILDHLDKPHDIMDPSLEGKYSVSAMQNTVAIARRCLQSVPEERPSMHDVVEALEPLLALVNNEKFAVDEILEEEPYNSPKHESKQILEEEPYRNLKHESKEILEEEPYRDPKHESKEILEEEKPDEYYERSEGRTPDKRITTTGTEAGISMEAKKILTEQPLLAHVDFDCRSDEYAAFIDELCSKLADHPGKATVHGRPLLAESNPIRPKRWVHIKLVGNNEETTTLAIKDDDVYLIGFQAKSGTWYEFGDKFGPGNVSMLTESTTFLGCEGRYPSLLGDSDTTRHMEDLPLGRESALHAIGKLSAYQQAEGQSVDKGTKQALARLMVMICESARLAPIYNTVKKGWDEGSVITEQQVMYIYSWGRISGFLMGRWIQQSGLRNIGIVEEKDAAEVVHLVLNSWSVRRQQAQPHVPVPVPAVVHGRFMLEVFSVKANYLVIGTIRVVDGKGRRIITFSYPSKEAIRNSQGNDPVSVRTTSMTLSRDVSANNSFRLKVNPDGSSDEYYRNADDNFTVDDLDLLQFDDSTIIQIPYDQNETDSVITSTHTTKDGEIEMAYALLSNALEATVQVKLKPKGVLTPDATVRVYGEIMAHCNDSNVILLFRREKEEAVQVDLLPTSDGLINILIPLARSVFAATVGSPLLIKVKLHAAWSSYDNTISFEEDLVFTPFGQRPKHTRKIDRPDMVAQVVITATLDEDLVVRETRGTSSFSSKKLRGRRIATIGRGRPTVRLRHPQRALLDEE